MNNYVLVSFLILLGLSYIYLGFKSATKIKSGEDYFIGGRQLGIFSLTMTLLATQLGGGALLGAADEAYHKGISVIFYPLGTTIGLIFLSLGFGAKLRTYNICTIAELFEIIYSSKKLRKIASLISIITMFFILVAQGTAVQKFFSSLGFNGPYFFYSFWFIIILYTVLGGLTAVVNTDIVQAIFFIISFIVVLISSYLITPELANISFISFTQSGNMSDAPWISWLLLPFLFMIIEQDMGQRCFAAKTPKIVTVSTLLAAIVFFICSIFPIFFGFLAKKLHIVVPEGQSILMVSIMKTTNPIVSAIFACAIFMIVISTADSLLCSISSNISFDFPIFSNAKENNKKSVLLAQTITFCVGILATFVSYFFDNVVNLIINSYKISIVTLFVPVFMAIISNRKFHFLSAWLSIFFGGLTFVLTILVKIDWPIPEEILCLLSSFLGFLLGSINSIKKYKS